MKSIVCTKLGNPELLEIKEIDKPVPSENEVLIKVEAAGVNYPDALLVQGLYQVLVEPPFTPGNEVCGFVEEVGSNTGFKKGTKVIGLPEIGGFSEYVVSIKIWLFLFLIQLILWLLQVFQSTTERHTMH